MAVAERCRQMSCVPWLACPEAANNFWGLANGLIACSRAERRGGLGPGGAALAIWVLLVL